MIKAVIFDLDGTLIDTEQYYEVCWPEAVAHFGYDLDREKYLSMRSLGRPFIIERMKGWFGPDYDYYEVKAYRKQIFEELIQKKGIQQRPGAAETIKALRARGIITAIATASDPERAYRYLSMAGLDECDFDKICCATQVAQGKPAPDVYLFACESIGCKPEECLAVEDSPNGIVSAYRAGCRPVYVPDRHDDMPEIQQYVYAKTESLTGILGLLE